MSFCIKTCLGTYGKDDDDDNESISEEAFDKQAELLSYIGTAAYNVLRKDHSSQHHTLWNITTGCIIDSVHQTPKHLSIHDNK